MLIAGFPDEMWMLQQLERKLSPAPKRTKKISKSSDKTSGTTGSSDAMFLVVMICTQAPAHWHPKIPIKCYGSIYFVSLVEKKCSSICPEKTTENSIQMINAHGVQTRLRALLEPAINKKRESNKSEHRAYRH